MPSSGGLRVHRRAATGGRRPGPRRPAAGAAGYEYACARVCSHISVFILVHGMREDPIPPSYHESPASGGGARNIPFDPCPYGVDASAEELAATLARIR